MNFTSTNQWPTLSYVLSLVGGLIVLLASVVNLVWFGSGAPYWGGFGGYMHGTMDGYHNFMGSHGSSYGFFAGISLLSLVCGIIIVISAIMLSVHPQEHMIWATVVIVFSAVSFVGMGVFS